MQATVISDSWSWTPAWSCACVLLLWSWAATGFRRSPSQASTTTYLERIKIVSGSFAGLCALALASPYLAALTSKLVVGLAASLLILSFEAFDPLKRSFWHHKRLRPIGSFALLAAALLLSWYTPAGVGAVFGGAVYVFHRYHRGTILLLNQCHDDIVALSDKMLAMQSTVGLLRSMMPESSASVRPLPAEAEAPLAQVLRAERKLHAGDDKRAKEG